jgi:hypothetical protein
MIGKMVVETPKKKMKKSKDEKIREAMEALQKAIDMEEPHIQISLPWCPDVEHDPKGKELLHVHLKTFMKEFKEYFGLEKVEIKILI